MTVDAEPRRNRFRQRLDVRRTKTDDDIATLPSIPAPPRMPARRNPKWVALGVAALCLGGLLSFVIYSRVATETSVVAVAQTVRRGATVHASDLKVVRLNGAAEVGVVPAAQLDSLVGKRAVYDLVAGSMLPVGAVDEVVIPAQGRSVVGVRLAAGRAPVDLLLPGSPVRLVAVPPAGADPKFADEYSGKSFTARIVSQAPGVDGTSIVVNVDLPATQGPVVAVLAAQDRLAVVRDTDK